MKNRLISESDSILNTIKNDDAEGLTIYTKLNSHHFTDPRFKEHNYIETAIKADAVKCLKVLWIINPTLFSAKEFVDNAYIFTAIAENAIKTIWFFSEIKANFTTKNKFNLTPLDSATISHKFKICEILVARFYKDEKDFTKLDLAIWDQPHSLTRTLNFLGAEKRPLRDRYDNNIDFFSFNKSFTLFYGYSPITVLKIMHSLEACRVNYHKEFDELFSGQVEFKESKIYHNDLISTPAMHFLDRFNKNSLPELKTQVRSLTIYHVEQYYAIFELLKAQEPSSEVTGKIKTSRSMPELSSHFRE